MPALGSLIAERCPYWSRTPCATSLLSVAKEAAAADPFWKQIYPASEDQLKTLQYYPYDAYFKDWDHIVEVWDRQVLRKG